MGRKAKVEKEEIASPKVDKRIKKDKKSPSPQSKPAKKDEGTDVFSAGFHQKIGAFFDLINDVSAMQGHSNSADYAETVKEDVSKKLEVESLKILREESATLLNTIEKGQSSLKDEIDQIQKAIESTRASLEATKAFSESEITSQLTVIKNRADEKRNALGEFLSLEKKAKELFD